MKTYYTLIFCFALSVSVHAHQPPILGVLNDVSVDKSFNEGQEAIKTSLLDSLGNMNLYEHAHCLKELYELLEAGEIGIFQWDNFIDTLSAEVERERKNISDPPFYAVEYKGIIPLQAEFFISSLDINTALKEQYPQHYKDLKKITSKLVGKGYTWEEIDTTYLTIYSRNESSPGTVNFWYFLQVYGCPLIELARTKEKEGWASLAGILKDLRPYSTYRVPLKLQFRKYHTLKQKIEPCADKYLYRLGTSVSVYDDDGKSYFDDDREGDIPRIFLKEF